MELSKIQKQLLHCLRFEINAEEIAEVALLSEKEWEALAQLAVEQRVYPLFYHRLKSRPALKALVPSTLFAQLQHQYQHNAVRNLQFMHELGKVLQALQNKGIPAIVLKGTHLAASVYDHPALRSMADVDILVDPQQIPTVIQTLEAMGYIAAIERDVQMQSVSSNHIPPMSKANLSIEVHRAITEPQRNYHIDPAELWTRAVPLKIANTQTFGFCLEDLLLHICIHLTYQHTFDQGIRGLCDIDLLIRRYQSSIHWAELTERANQWGWANGVYVALYLAKELMGTPLSDQQLRALKVERFTQQIAQEAVTHLFAQKAEGGLSKDFIQLSQAQTVVERLRIFGKRLFLPRQTIADIYRVPVKSPWLYLCYFRRFGYFIRQYWGLVMQLWRGEANLSERLARQNKLIDWLEASRM